MSTACLHEHIRMCACVRGIVYVYIAINGFLNTPREENTGSIPNERFIFFNKTFDYQGR